MSNFQLDKLTLDLTNSLTESYLITGTCNVDLPPPDIRNILDGSELNSEKEYVIDISDNLSIKEATVFQREFSYKYNYGKRDYIYILFAGANEQYAEVAGVCIKDTDYPPPYGSHKVDDKDTNLEISHNFIINSIRFERDADPTFFKVTLELFVKTNSYSAVKALVVENENRPGSFVLVLHVVKDNINGTPANGYINFPVVGSNDLYISKLQGDIAVVVTDDAVGHISWNNIIRKKMMVFIETPKIDRMNSK